MEKVESQFKLRGIILTESKFRRIPEIALNQGENTETHVEIKSENKDNKNLATELIIDLVSKFKDKIQFEVRVVMVGLFEAENSTAEQIDSFGKINAPAIIFPFVREHVLSLTLKGGLPPVALPIVNFVEHANKSQVEQKGAAVKTP